MQIFTEAGRGSKKLFARGKDKPPGAESSKTVAPPKQESNLPPPTPTTTPITHDFSFGAVYANEPARAEIEGENPKFPVGAILVRERNATPTSETPEALVVMVKREKGFSPETNDWEFFTFDGKDLSLKSRETKGSRCVECHARAEKTDWVFKTYLK